MCTHPCVFLYTGAGLRESGRLDYVYPKIASMVTVRMIISFFVIVPCVATPMACARSFQLSRGSLKSTVGTVTEVPLKDTVVSLGSAFLAFLVG